MIQIDLPDGNKSIVDEDTYNYIQSLKCCGNCIYYFPDDVCKYDDKAIGNDYCGHWEFDGATQEERMT